METASPPGRGPWTYRDLCERLRSAALPGFEVDVADVPAPAPAAFADAGSPRRPE